MTAPTLSPPGPLAPGGLRVTALGGIGEIGRNMTVFEHLGRLLIIDCGVLFPGHDEPGIDLILPDLRHIADRLDDVEALVLTHAHEDHIGAIPFLLKMRGDIPVVGSRFTLALVAEKCREHRIKPHLVQVAEGQRSTHGVFECEYFAVNHSIPDALAIAIHTGAGTVLHTGDIKLDQLPLDGRPTDLPGMSRLGDAGVDLFLCDSTNAEIPGVGPSESEIGPTLHRLIRGADGRRVIVACFASNVDRVQSIVDAAVALGRRVSFVGRSMVRNMAIARDLGFLKVDDANVVDIGAAEMMSPDSLVLITTGTQGEPLSALSRMSRGEHRSITITADDLIILSSSLIPGNEEAVYGVIDALSKIGARVVTNQQARVHVSGHAYAGELLFLYNGVRPRNVMPVHGTWRHLRANAKLAARTGVPEESIMLAENGVSVDLFAGQASIAGAVPVGKMFIDGLVSGDVGDATLGERLILSSGFISVTVVMHRGTGKMAAPPHLHSRGFSEDPKALDPAARFKNRNATSPVPPATSSNLCPGRGASQSIIASFQSRCTPPDMRSFMMSYLLATRENTPCTIPAFSASGTF